MADTGKADRGKTEKSAPSTASEPASIRPVPQVMQPDRRDAGSRPSERQPLVSAVQPDRAAKTAAGARGTEIPPPSDPAGAALAPAQWRPEWDTVLGETRRSAGDKSAAAGPTLRRRAEVALPSAPLGHSLPFEATPPKTPASRLAPAPVPGEALTSDLPREGGPSGAAMPDLSQPPAIPSAAAEQPPQARKSSAPVVLLPSLAGPRAPSEAGEAIAAQPETAPTSRPPMAPTTSAISPPPVPPRAPAAEANAVRREAREASPASPETTAPPAPAGIAEASSAPAPASTEAPGLAEAASEQPATASKVPPSAAEKPTAFEKPTALEKPSVSEQPSASEKGDQEDYEVMTVFYGTDRQAAESAAPTGWTFSDWAYLTVILGGLTLLLGALAYFHPRNRLLLLLTAAAVVGTGTLGFFTARAGRGEVRLAGGEVSRVYGNDRGTLEMGTCRVTIPKTHQTGEMERPSIFRLEIQEDPQRHIVLLSVEQQQEEAFFSGLKAHVNQSQKGEVLVFVHGFNVTFEAAARRTAQLAYDLKIDGAPVFFSWPSQGGLLRYAVDETNVAWTVPHLKEFLVGVARRSGARSVNLIAHSMGSRALTSALQILSYELKNQAPIFNQVVLTAPDIDADVFKRDIAPRIVRTAGRVTLYASSNDEALRISKEIHGYPRAGDSGHDLVVVPGIDTVDVTMVDTSLVGHSYYGSNDSVLRDMLDLINDSKPPEQRKWLRPVSLGEMSYWVFTSPQSGLKSSRKAGEVLRQ